MKRKTVSTLIATAIISITTVMAATSFYYIKFYFMNNNSESKYISPPPKVIHVAQSGLPVFARPIDINTQKDLDNYMLYRFVNGISDNGEVIEVNNPHLSNISAPLKFIIEDTGFEIKIKKNKNKLIYKLDFSEMIRSQKNVEKYSKQKFLQHIKKVTKDIYASKMMNAKNRREMLQKFNTYIMQKYRYRMNFKIDDMKGAGASPYAILDDNTAICSGFVHYANMANLLMRIPSFMSLGVTQDTIKEEDYHAQIMALDEKGEWFEINNTPTFEPITNDADAIKNQASRIKKHLKIEYPENDLRYNENRKILITNEIYK